MGYGTGPTTVQVDYGLLVQSPMCRCIVSSDRPAQMCSERVDDSPSSTKE